MMGASIRVCSLLYNNKAHAIQIVLRWYWHDSLFVKVDMCINWRLNEPDVFSSHWHFDLLPNRLIGHRPKKISKLRVNGLCEGNSPVTGCMTSSQENLICLTDAQAISNNKSVSCHLPLRLYVYSVDASEPTHTEDQPLHQAIGYSLWDPSTSRPLFRVEFPDKYKTAIRLFFFVFFFFFGGVGFMGILILIRWCFMPRHPQPLQKRMVPVCMIMCMCVWLYSFQPVGPWMGYSFTDLGAERWCRSLNALFILCV